MSTNGANGAHADVDDAAQLTLQLGGSRTLTIERANIVLTGMRIWNQNNNNSKTCR